MTLLVTAFELWPDTDLDRSQVLKATQWLCLVYWLLRSIRLWGHKVNGIYAKRDVHSNKMYVYIAYLQNRLWPALHIQLIKLQCSIEQQYSTEMCNDQDSV